MAKAMNDGGADAALTYWTDADEMYLCSAQPATRAEAITYSLADVAPTFDAITNGDTNGRKRRVQAKTGVTVDANGTGTHVALCKAADTSLRYITTAPSQGVNTGGTVDFGAWDIEIADPT